MIDVFIAGAQKAGTTSILRYLENHPDVVAHPQVEMGFFAIESEFQKGDVVLRKKYKLEREKQDQIIVVKQASMSNLPFCIQRLYEKSPNCKIIFLTRDPVERAFSSYEMNKRINNHPENFNQVIKNGLDDKDHWHYRNFIGLGEYARLLNNMNCFFPKDQIKVIRFEDMKFDASKIVNELLQWMGLPQQNLGTHTAHNTKSDLPVERLKRKIKSEKLRSLVLKMIGRSNTEKILKILAIIFLKKRKTKQENLADYPEAIALLKEHYFQFREDSKAWGVEYK